ncbi:putative uncharacterized protein [Burkholderiales bacterium GJ-E10]|nr:putative uncharacterized protein [Burkholderiales bacterium GJ-E10]
MVGYVTTIKEKLIENETIREQARNNTEEQFHMGDFKEILLDTVIDAKDGHNRISDQLLKDERIFTAMQGLLGKMVYQALTQGKPGDANMRAGL